MVTDTLLTVIIQICWLLLPAGSANMAPVLFKWVPFLNVPVDFGKKFNGKRITGDHKTYRGFLAGIIVSTIVVFLQGLVNIPEEFVLLPASTNPFLYGFIFGFGALSGDSIKSFFKRQRGVPEGKTWFPFDQLDWVVGVYSLIFVYGHMFEPVIYFVSFALALIVHPTVNLLGYYLGVKKNKF